MYNSHAVFHSKSGKRNILIVDDELINREILSVILKDEYDVILAEDGEAALREIVENADTLSAILLDLIMPGIGGVEVLKRIKADPELKHIPVLVASADQTKEIECLDAGAGDFINKPYPEPGVILARVRRSIELAEDRQIIQSTERDPLTGLYNCEYFYRYAEQFDQFHKDMSMDAIMLDINHFSILNERYGRAYADDILRKVAEKAREIVHSIGGIVCRRDADVFLIYCPHIEDYRGIMESASKALSLEQNAGGRVRLRMGVYSEVDKSLDIERRFDRAKTAADSVRNSVTRNIGMYDDRLYKADLYAEQLIEDFHKAIEEKQFLVYYQPKFDIRPETPVLNSAEGLVRWKHPELGLISPGVFIPLFEENGLIQELDHYVWEEAAGQIRRWKEKIGFSVPVSVNISRVDMYDSTVAFFLQEILENNGLTAKDLHLEVTESAYAEDSKQIIEMVKKLRMMGHEVEMDDFGSGYSSLNMLSEMPIDCLKLDMQFVRTAFSGEKDLRLLELIMGIADHMHVPVIAEGVETEEQLEGLKEIGCDFVQGYYFSPPIPADEFENFLVERKAQAEAEQVSDQTEKKKNASKSSYEKNKRKETFRERISRTFNISMGKASIVFAFIAIILAAALFLCDSMVTQGYIRTDKSNERYILARQAATSMEMGSDYLTERVRSFVVSADITYLKEYFEEAEVTKSRDNAVAELEELLGDDTSTAYEHLSRALAFSNELMDLEYHAMKLVLESGAVVYDPADVPDVVKNYVLLPEEYALTPNEMREKSVQLVYGDEYEAYKNQIRNNTSECTDDLIAESYQLREESARSMETLLTVQTILIIAVIIIILIIIVFIIIWIKNPLSEMVKRMRAKKRIYASGASELRYVSDTHNEIYEENRKAHERLNYGATHDSLTGLYNRSAYEIMSRDLDLGQTALIIVDVDKFKSINDTYGHAVGDIVLKNVAKTLENNFRSDDMIFRVGGDEFVIIMTRADSSMGNQVKSKFEQMNMMLQKPKGDVPPVSLSVGVAFSDRENPEGDIFKDADTALYRVKNAGRCGCEVY